MRNMIVLAAHVALASATPAVAATPARDISSPVRMSRPWPRFAGSSMATARGMSGTCLVLKNAPRDPALGLTPEQVAQPGFGQSDDRPYAERQRHPPNFDAQSSQRPIAVHALEHLGLLPKVLLTGGV